MGYDYCCPNCGGPAYGDDHERWCEACRKDLPTNYTCHWCKQYVYSTTREGGERCESKTYCANMICSSCRREKKYVHCMNCFEDNLPPEQVERILDDQIRLLDEKIAQLKYRKQHLHDKKVEKEEEQDTRSDCKQQ